MASISLKIPVAMQAAFEAQKDKFNVSKVCQEAIQRELTYQLRFTEALSDQERLIARLNAEWQDLRNEAFQAGRLLGADDFSELSYVQIQRAVEGHDQQWDANQWLRALQDEFDWIEADEEYSDAQKHQFMKGWGQAISELWDEIKAEVEVDA